MILRIFFLFYGIDEFIKERLSGEHRIGFVSDSNSELLSNKDELIHYATPQDVRDFGFIPEFVGRFPIITNVDKLSKDALIKILKEPKNAIVKQYTELLKMDNMKLKFTNDALEEIADLAFNLETGARGLRSIMEIIMMDFMFEAPSMAKEGKNIITINGEVVREKTKKKFSVLKSA